ncbi:MAG TPA: MFS transporter [Solirubrobacteraceae bacterium]|jgi:predicted MFS family arabinose efflux permease|nr:MFS transporter [Solirubrobacteraceae bacterium]
MSADRTPTVNIPRHPWRIVAAYALVAAASQMLWLTFAPITTASAHHFHVSEAAVGWLSEVFPLLYVVLAIPAGMALDRWFRASLIAGGALTAIGGLVRLGGGSFAWALAGQVIIAAGQPLILNGITKLATEYLPADKRPDGIAYGSAGIFGGMLVGFGLGPALGSSGDLKSLLIVNAVFALLALTVLAIALRTPGQGSAQVELPAMDALRTVWSDRLIRNLAGVSFLGFGVFVAVTTWLQALLKPAGVSSGTAGGLLAGMVIVGLIGSAALPAAVARRGQTYRLLQVTSLGACLGCAVLATLGWLPAFAVAVAVIGFFLLTSLPVLLDLTERRAGAHGGAASALMWMAGQGGGIVLALMVQAIVHHPTASFLLLALAALGALPLVNAAARLATQADPVAAESPLIAYDV